MKKNFLLSMINKGQRKVFYWHRQSRLLLPGTCLICMQPLVKKIDLCTPCLVALPRNLMSCQFCAKPIPAARQPPICKNCTKAPTAFNQVLAPWLYLQPYSQLVWEFKYKKNLAAGYLLVDLLFDVINENKNNYDCLVVIPGQKDRIKLRGIDAPSWLAKRLALLTGVLFDNNGLKRVKDIPSQQGLDRKERWLNPRNAFKATATVQGKKVLLFDDVVTTGASAHWAAKALKQEGALSVDVLTTAKTPDQYKA